MVDDILKAARGAGRALRRPTAAKNDLLFNISHSFSLSLARSLDGARCRLCVSCGKETSREERDSINGQADRTKERQGHKRTRERERVRCTANTATFRGTHAYHLCSPLLLSFFSLIPPPSACLLPPRFTSFVGTLPVQMCLLRVESLSSLTVVGIPRPSLHYLRVLHLQTTSLSTI